MNFENMYLLSDACVRGALIVVPPDDFDEERAFRGLTNLAEPVKFEYHMGGRPRDLIGTGYAGVALFSNRVIELLERHEFTGWKTYPVVILGKKLEKITGYRGFSVTGQCGPIDWSKGQKVRRPPRAQGGMSYDAWVGICFDPTSWDGSDIFTPVGTTMTIVVERVKEVLEGIKATNVKFKPLTDFERSWPVE